MKVVSIKLIKVIYCSSMMIKAIVFDYNGVLTQEGHFEPFLSRYAHKQGKDERYLQRLVREEWDLAREGQNDGTEVWNKAAAYLGVPLEEFRKGWEDNFPLRSEMLGLVRVLRPHYKTAVMTNMIQCWWEDVRREYLLPDYFGDVFTSYEIGAAKPDTRIFEYALERLELKAEECLFIDDQTKNTAVAQRLGFEVILFASPGKLRLELNGRRIII